MPKDRLQQIYVSGAVLVAMDENVPGGHGPEEPQALRLRSLSFTSNTSQVKKSKRNHFCCTSYFHA